MSLFSKKQPDIPARRHHQTTATERVTSPSLDQRYNFKRNRTLTGSASSQVSTVGEAHAQLKSDRVRAHDLVHQRRRVLMVLAAVLIVGAVLYGLVSQFTAHAVVKGDDSSLVLENSVYIQAIDEYFQAQPIERLRFMLNVSRLTDYLQAAAPEVDSVKVDGSAGLGKTEFILSMRRPIAGWSMSGNQQYVDSHGIAFTRNYFADPHVQIVDKSGVEVAAGTAIASNQFLGFVGRVVGLSTARQLTVTEVIIPQDTARQIELRIENIAYPVKLSVDRPAGEQVEDMDRSLAWLVSRGVSPQYLDVRTSGRAFYR